MCKGQNLYIKNKTFISPRSEEFLYKFHTKIYRRYLIDLTQ